MRTAADIVEALGAVLIVAGLAAVALPLALMVAGLFLIMLANSVTPATRRVRR